jgi:hypothetical protein
MWLFALDLLQNKIRAYSDAAINAVQQKKNKPTMLCFVKQTVETFFYKYL